MNAPRSQREVLNVLKVAADQIYFSLLILIFSREDKAIRDFFNKTSIRPISDRIISDEKYHPDADIRIYLQSKFNDTILLVLTSLCRGLQMQTLAGGREIIRAIYLCIHRR